MTPSPLSGPDVFEQAGGKVTSSRDATDRAVSQIDA